MKIAIGYPCYDSRCEAQAMQVIMQCLTDPNHPVTNVIMQNGDSLVTRARNKIVHQFLQTDCDYLMFIDSDILFQAEDIKRLVSHNRAVVGGVYFKKKLPYSPVANRHIRDTEDGLHVMGEIGTGFMLVDREVFAEIRKLNPEHYYKAEGDEIEGEYYDYFRVGVVDGRYLSEDYYFCKLARDAGYEIHLDPQVITQHVGRAVYPFDDQVFLRAGADFLLRYNMDVPMKKELFDNFVEAVEHHKKERKLWS